MTTSPLRAAWLLIAAATWTPQPAMALFLPADGAIPALWQRATASSDCVAGFAQCSNADLPSNFCCSTGSTCNVLAGNTTVLCCPKGSSCASIDPITCDLSLQDASLHPDSVIKTTALNGAMPRCGANSCCPFGYSCDGTGTCVVNVNQNVVPLQNVPTTTATAAATTATAKTTSASTKATHATTQTSTAAGVTVVEATTRASASGSAAESSLLPSAAAGTGTTGASTGASKSASASSAASSSGDSSPPTASVVGGVVGGLAGLVLLGAAVWFFCGRRFRRRHSTSSLKRNAEKLPDAKKLSRSTSSFGNIINNPLAISSPKPQGDATAFRTDFIRKLPSSSGPPGLSSRPVTPANSAAGLLVGSARSAGSAGSTVGTVGYTYQTSGGKSAAVSPLSAIASHGFAGSITPSSPSPPPLALHRNRDSIPVAPIRGMRSSLPRQQSQHQSQNPSLEEINVGADPSIIGLGAGFPLSPPAFATAALAAATGPGANTNYSSDRNRSDDRMTTFSGLMAAASLDPNRPFVPDSVQSTPASRRR